MSFKIFTLQLTGKFKPAEKIEAQRIALEKAYKAFLEAESSPKLSEFRKLESWVTSGSMNMVKRDMESQVFKGSLEHNQLSEFEVLKKNRSIRNFFRLEGSPELNRFYRIRESEKLKEYYQLKDYSEGGLFIQEKREIESQKFSGSVEERQLNELGKLKKNTALKDFMALHGSQSLKRHQQFLESAKLYRFLELKNMHGKEKSIMKEFRQLKSDSDIREYFRMEKSKALKHFHEIAGSHIPDRYNELLKETSSPEFLKRTAFLKDGKKLEKSEAWKKFLRYKNLSKDSDIKFFLSFEKSKLYTNYLDTRDSFALLRYNELLELTTSPDFLKRKVWLEDKRKWEKSPEYDQYQHYLELKKDPQVELYFKYEKSSAFDFLKSWEISFVDNFESKTLDHVKWTPNSLWAERLVGGNFSQNGDLQAYTGGKNCQIAHGKLFIHVKKEKFSSRQWQPSIGFVPSEFSYTSDTLSSLKSFWQQYGIFEAKILYNPYKEVVSSFYLQGESISPLISLLEMGPQPRMGILSADGAGKPHFSGLDLKYLKPGKFYIFRLEWEAGRIVWKINDIIVYESHSSGMNEAAHVNLTSLVINDIAASRLPASFEVDWIRCYRKKQSV